MRIICALLRARNGEPKSGGSTVFEPMAVMWKFGLRPQGRLFADSGLSEFPTLSNPSGTAASKQRISGAVRIEQVQLLGLGLIARELFSAIPHKRRRRVQPGSQ